MPTTPDPNRTSITIHFSLEQIEAERIVGSRIPLDAVGAFALSQKINWPACMRNPSITEYNGLFSCAAEIDKADEGPVRAWWLALMDRATGQEGNHGDAL